MLSILFCGDIYLNNVTDKKISLSPDFDEVVQECDYVCYNLEGPIVDRDAKCADKKGLTLNQSCEKIKDMFHDKKIICTLANNHIMDYGVSGLEHTKKKLASHQFVGAGKYNEAYAPLTINKYGNIAIINLAESGFGVCKEKGQIGYAWLFDPLIKDRIKSIKKECRYLIAVCHAGLEDVNVPFPELRTRYRQLIDMGADCVIAHHPHIIQGMEEYKDSPIYYSLGNFAFEYPNKDEVYLGNGICIKVDIDDEHLYTKHIGVEFSGNTISLSSASEELYEQANSKLNNVYEYNKFIDEISIDFYKKIYRPYYQWVYGSKNRLLNLIKAFISLFSSKMFDEVMLYHNLSIETHRWVTLRGLELSRKGLVFYEEK